MKKNTLIIVILLLLFGCKNSKQQQQHIGDVIINQIENDYSVNINKDTLKDGTLEFTFSFKGEKFLADEKSMIGSIDKTLGKVPDEIKEGEVGYRGKHLYNTYVWNTPEIKLDIQSSFRFNDGNDSIYVRIFMNKK